MAETDDLEKRLKRRSSELDQREQALQRRQQSLGQQTPDGTEQRPGIDNVVEEPHTETGSIDDMVERKEPSFLKSLITNTIGVGVGFGLSGMIFGSAMSAIYMAGSWGVGYIVEKITGKQRFKIKDFMKELSTGALLSPLGLGIYSSVDIINNSSFLGKLGRLALFAGPMAAAFIYINRNFLYFRDKLGVKGTLQSLYKGTFFKHLYKAHKEEGAPNLGKGLKTAFLNFSPIWMYTLNYLQNPATRLAIGNVNDVLYRLLIGGKDVKSDNIWVMGYKGIKKGVQKIGNIGKGLYEKIHRYTTPDTYKTAFQH